MRDEEQPADDTQDIEFIEQIEICEHGSLSSLPQTEDLSLAKIISARSKCG
jgi:hypothetical protein